MVKWIGVLGILAVGLLFFILLFRFLAGLPTNTNFPAKRGFTFMDILIIAITILVVAILEDLPVAITLALLFVIK